MKSRAFTLIELLVAVSVCAVLVSILLPCLSKARSAYREMNCKANVRSIRQGIAVYLASAPQKLPPANLKITNPDVASLGPPSLERFISIGWNKVYFCPSTRAIVDHPDRSSYNYSPGGGLVAAGQSVNFVKSDNLSDHNADFPLVGEAWRSHRGGVHIATTQSVSWKLPAANYPLEEEP